LRGPAAVLHQFLEVNIWMLTVVMTRVGTMLSLVPGFGAGYVPPRYRIAIAATISFLLLPTVSQYIPAMPKSVPMLFLTLAGEVVLGAFFASIAIVAFSALQAAGTFISYFSSMANALVQDAVAQQQSSVISGFLGTTGLVLMFVTDLHHLVLRAIAESFAVFRPGAPLLFADMSNMMARHVADAFTLGLQLASPMLVVAMVYYLSLGVLGRLMPALQVFFFGLPVQITVQFWVFMICFSGIMLVFLRMFSESYMPFLGQ